MTNPINRALPPPKQIRFVNNQGQPPSKRRRINAAYVFSSSPCLYSRSCPLPTPRPASKTATAFPRLARLRGLDGWFSAMPNWMEF